MYFGIINDIYMYISQLTIIIVQLTAHNFLLRFTIYNKQFAIYYVQVIL